MPAETRGSANSEAPLTLRNIAKVKYATVAYRIASRRETSVIVIAAKTNMNVNAMTEELLNTASDDRSTVRI